jgi:hypothetical protein
MKVIDIRNFSVVKVGQACVLPEPTDVHCLIKIMQKNEKYVYWLQPKNADFSCQIPALYVNGNYVQPSVKLEKAIFRHIRLTRNFQNFELLEDGKKKLRIPIRLLQEKQRTSNKFSVSLFLFYILSNKNNILTIP